MYNSFENSIFEIDIIFLMSCLSLNDMYAGLGKVD